MSSFELRKSASNLISVIGGETLLRAANFASAVLIARMYGPTMFGLYATVLAYATLGERIADNGLEVSTIADVSQCRSQAGTIWGERCAIKGVLCLFAVLTMTVIGLFAGLSKEVWIVGTLVAFRTLLYSFARLNAAFIKALGKMRIIGLTQSVHFTVILIGLVTVYVRSLTLTTLLVWLIAGQVLEFMLSSLYLSGQGVMLRSFSISNWRSVLWRSAPVGLAYTIGTLILRADVIILSILVPASVVGHFAAADTGLVMVYVVAWLFGGVILARMASLASDVPSLLNYCQRWVRFIVTVVGPISIVIALAAPFVLSLLFGGEYVPAGRVGALMALSVPFILLNAVYLSRAIVIAGPRVYLTIYGAVCVFSVLLDFLLGRSFGPMGVSAAIVAREAAMFAAFLLIGAGTGQDALVETPGTEERRQLESIEV